MKRFYVALVFLVFVFAAHSVLAAPYAYIAQINLGTLSVIDTVKNKKVTTINVGGAPFALTMSPDGRTAYVARTTYPPMEGWISVIDVLTHSVTDTIAVGNSPQGAAVLPNGTKLYVTDCGDAPGITIINTSSNTTEKTIPFGRCLFGVAAHPDGSKVYFTDWSDDLVARIDTVSETVDMTTVTVGRLPIGIAVRPYSSEAYVTNWAGQSISVIDTSSNSVIDTISLAPESPNYLAFNTSGTRAYVTNDGGTNVWVIDTGSRTVISTINVGAQSYGIDVTPDGAYVYVAVCGYDDKEKEINCGVRVIETATNTVKKKIKLPGGASSGGKFIGGPQYHMNVSTSGPGKVISKKLPDIDCGSGGIKCEADFYINRKVQLQAVPDAGFVFTGWSGDCTGKGKTCKFLIGKDYSVTATFEPK